MTIRVSPQLARLFTKGGKRPVIVEKVAKPRGTFGLDTAIPVDEETIHISVYEWLCLVLPDALIFHPPNGGYRDVREAVKLKRMGVVPGVPDLIVFLDGAFVCGFEIKTQKGRLSAEQHGFQGAMRKLGFRVATVRGIDETRQALASWAIPTREAKS